MCCSIDLPLREETAYDVLHGLQKTYVHDRFTSKVQIISTFKIGKLSAVAKLVRALSRALY
jgi:hypothetical protein